MKIHIFPILLACTLIITTFMGCSNTTSDSRQSGMQGSDALVTAGNTTDEPRYGGTLIVSFAVGTPIHFNPALISGSATGIIGTQIFASPLRYDEDWNPLPYLAESWEISDDGLAVTLNLVKGATFHDGHAVTSEDIAFSIMTIKENHPFKSMFKPVQQVDTPDDYTAVIRLTRPHPAILLALSPNLCPIIPKHVYGDGQEISTHPANLHPIGCGPFRFVSYEPGKTVVLKRNENFFIEGRPYLDEIIFRIESDSNINMMDMERQETHLMPVMGNPTDIDRLEESLHLSVSSQGYEAIGAINWLAFNLLREPLDNKLVRQAIAYAIDKQFITEYLHNGRSRCATGPIALDSPFYEPDVTKYEYDLDMAARLLDQAGYPLHPDGSRFSLTLDYIPAIPSLQREVALYIAHQLEKLGIAVEVRESSSFPEWAERVSNWDFDMIMDSVYNWGDPVIGVERTYMSDNIRKGVVWSNTQNYRNPEVDEILEQARIELNINKRKALYSEFQQIVVEDLPIIWINTSPFYTAYHNGLGNLPLTIWGVHSPFDEVYWKEFPSRQRMPLPAFDNEHEKSHLMKLGIQAIELLWEHGLYDAMEQLTDEDQGFLDLDATGRHVIGVTANGYIFLDNSGQMKPGMDIDDLLDTEGNRILPQLIEAAEGKNGGYITSQGMLPHPENQEILPCMAWCGMLYEGEIICVLEFNGNDGGGL